MSSVPSPAWHCGMIYVYMQCQQKEEEVDMNLLTKPKSDVTSNEPRLLPVCCTSHSQRLQEQDMAAGGAVE